MCFGDVENQENNGTEEIGLVTPTPEELGSWSNRLSYKPAQKG